MKAIIEFLKSRDQDGCYGFETVAAYLIMIAPMIAGALVMLVVP